MDKADLILTNAKILTMNEAFEIFYPGALAIRGVCCFCGG